MNDLSELLRLCAILRGRPARNAYDWQAAEAIEALIRERDEARAAVTTANFVVADYQRDLEEAHAKAIEEAAELARIYFGPESFIRQKIIALKDKQ